MSYCPDCKQDIRIGDPAHTCLEIRQRKALSPSGATACSVVAPNLVQAGDLWLMEDEDSYNADKMEYSILIQCANAEQVREAMKTGKIEFTVFAHYPHNETSPSVDAKEK